MHRFYLPPDQCAGPRLTLTGREAHHALHVLRVRRGERVVVLDGAGAECLCEVGEPTQDGLALALIQKNCAAPLPYQLTLLQAVPKGRIMEAIIQKATELGVRRVVPILSERSVPQLDEESAEARAGRWQQAAIEAIKQCGNPWLPLVEAPVTPRSFLARQERFELALVGSLQNDRRHPRDCFREFQTEYGRGPQSVGVWIGPEGDYTPAELSAIKADGARPISLGPLILRSETAAVYCLAVVNYELQAGP